MKTDNLDDLFKGLDFDQEEPAADHEQRFREKLRRQKKKKSSNSGVIRLWLPGLMIAATFMMSFLIFEGVFNNPFDQQQELATVSPEMKQTQDFYASVIKQELETLEGEKTPKTEAVIDDALKQLQILEKDYNGLKKDLARSGQDKRVIYAMIDNFQKRIDLLHSVLEKVNTINTLNNNPHEDNLL